MSPAPRTPRQLSKILVPTDFSPSSDAAVDYATFLAERFGASVDVLYVWNARAESVRGARAIFSGDSASGRAMAACVRDGARVGIKLRGRFEFGELSPTIGSVAESGAFDLIVMGLHENGRLAHFFGGDVAREVARIASCPVITVRADVAGPVPREAPFAPWTELAGGALAGNDLSTKEALYGTAAQRDRPSRGDAVAPPPLAHGGHASDELVSSGLSAVAYDGRSP